MNKQQHIELKGQIINNLKGRKYLVEIRLGKNTHKAVCTLKGKLLKNKNKHQRDFLVGDNVKVELSTYDLSNGYITGFDKTVAAEVH